MTFVSMVTVAFTLFFLGATAIGYSNLLRWMSFASSQSAVVAYLSESAGTDSTVQNTVLQRIRSLDAVASLTVVGKDAAWERFENLYGATMLDAVGENPFPVAVEIALVAGHQSLTAVENLRSAIASIEGVESVRYAVEWISALGRIRGWLFAGTIVIVPIILLALHFMVANTIKLTIYARRDIIRSMRFVGATDAWIRAPFVLEGMLQGMIGGSMAVAALFAARFFLSGHGIVWGPWYLMPGVFMTGIVFGWLGSISAVRKFLD